MRPMRAIFQGLAAPNLPVPEAILFRDATIFMHSVQTDSRARVAKARDKNGFSLRSAWGREPPAIESLGDSAGPGSRLPEIATHEYVLKIGGSRNCWSKEAIR